MNRTVVIYLLGAAIVALVLRACLASSSGAVPGYSGGHVNGGLNCMACHEFNAGPGGVELLDAPKLYAAGGVYNLTVRVFDPEQGGAGFQISAESATGHQGFFFITDPTNTQYANIGRNTDYVTHTGPGYENSKTAWLSSGSVEYQLRWIAPESDAGPITFFTAGNTVNISVPFLDDRYYATHAITHFTNRPDADGDEDVDLYDFAAFQRCYDAEDPSTPPECEAVDVDVQSFFSALVGPTATTPSGYLLADPVRGGLLYDKWWAVTGISPPTNNHPLYPQTSLQSGSPTFRCKECHGWDYQGNLGAYGSDPDHFTGIPGVFGSTLTKQQLFDLLKADQNEIPNGHDMDLYGMTDEDLWDVVRMTLEGVVLTSDYIDGTGAFRPELDANAGSTRYNDTSSCWKCHGPDGTDINFGTIEAPEHIGGLARRNPWEFLHKVRFGHPASPMPSSELLLWTVSEAAEVGAHSATLPQ